MLRHFQEKKQVSKSRAYCQLRNHYLLFFNTKEESKNKSKPQPQDLPFKIIYLEGLYIEPIPKEEAKVLFGFMISHKNPSYGVCQIEFEEQREFEKWNEHLLTQAKLLQDEFRLTEEVVGRGRFSVVHKGFSKTKKDMEVAIKIIEKACLDKDERDIIQ